MQHQVFGEGRKSKFDLSEPEPDEGESKETPIAESHFRESPPFHGSIVVTGRQEIVCT